MKDKALYDKLSRMDDQQFLNWLESLKDTLERLDDHYDQDFQESMGWVIEALSEAVGKLDGLIEVDAEHQEAQKTYNEILIEQNAINFGMNRL